MQAPKLSDKAHRELRFVERVLTQNDIPCWAHPNDPTKLVITTKLIDVKGLPEDAMFFGVLDRDSENAWSYTLQVGALPIERDRDDPTVLEKSVYKNNEVLNAYLNGLCSGLKLPSGFVCVDKIVDEEFILNMGDPNLTATTAIISVVGYNVKTSTVVSVLKGLATLPTPYLKDATYEL